MISWFNRKATGCSLEGEDARLINKKIRDCKLNAEIKFIEAKIAESKSRSFKHYCVGFGAIISAIVLCVKLYFGLA